MRLGVLERSADNPAQQYREYRRVRNEWMELEAPGSTRPEEPDFLCFLTLPIGMLAFQSSQGQQTNLLMAAVAMSVIPMIIIFVLMQKQLVKGIMLGGVKG